MSHVSRPGLNATCCGQASMRCVEARPRCEDLSRLQASLGPRREDQARLDEASTRPRSEALMLRIKYWSRPWARNELGTVVRSLTMVNSRLDAQEVERTMVTRCDRSAGQGTTMVRPPVGPVCH